MCAAPAGRMMGPCQGERHRTPEEPGDDGRTGPGRRSTEMRTLKTTRAYARYLLTSLATVAFGLSSN